MSKDGNPFPNEAPCNATAMRKASRRLTQMYDDALEGCGLRSTQFAILVELYLWLKEPPTVAELAAKLVMDRSALGHNLRPLAREGLVALQEGTEDRRRRHVGLTLRGRAKVREALRLWEKAQARFNAVFGESRAAKLRATLLEIAFDERLGTLKG
jgi:DNA-binding MarR family transcriptional regulator